MKNGVEKEHIVGSQTELFDESVDRLTFGEGGQLRASLDGEREGEGVGEEVGGAESPEEEEGVVRGVGLSEGAEARVPDDHRGGVGAAEDGVGVVEGRGEGAGEG